MDKWQAIYWGIGIVGGALVACNTAISLMMLLRASGQREAQYVTWDELHKFCRQRHNDQDSQLDRRFKALEGQLDEIKEHLDKVSESGENVARNVASIHGYLAAIAEKLPEPLRKGPPT